MGTKVRIWELKLHSARQCRSLERVAVEVTRTQSFLCEFLFRACGDMACVRLPRTASLSRCNELWKHTCFEVFLMRSDGSYYEFNLAPSSQWAAYRFAAYREGMKELDLPVAPRIKIAATPESFTLEATIDLREQLDPKADASVRMALCAVIEERDGRLCHWALAHPPGKPDFHHADGFVGALPHNVV